MATEDVRVPLLGGEEEIAERESEGIEDGEDIEIRYHMNVSKGKAASDYGLGDRVCQRNISMDEELVVVGGVDEELMLEVPGEERSRSRKKQYSGSEMIVAVFVVAFDTKRGKRKGLL